MRSRDRNSGVCGPRSTAANQTETENPPGPGSIHVPNRLGKGGSGRAGPDGTVGVVNFCLLTSWLGPLSPLHVTPPPDPPPLHPEQFEKFQKNESGHQYISASGLAWGLLAGLKPAGWIPPPRSGGGGGSRLLLMQTSDFNPMERDEEQS